MTSPSGPSRQFPSRKKPAPTANLRVKVYGERNSGTNYLSQLMARNFDVRVMPGVTPRRWLKQYGTGEDAKDRFFSEQYARNLGWKHAMAPTRRQLESLGVPTSQLVFVTVTKNPYSWLLSLFKRPYHATRRATTFGELINSPWEPLGRENCVGEFQTPMELWNCKNRSYVSLYEANLRAINLRYEDILIDPLAVLQRLHEAASLPLKGTEFVNVTTSTKDARKDFQYYQDYYLNERWRERLAAADVETINQHLDRRLVRYFSYELL